MHKHLVWLVLTFAFLLVESSAQQPPRAPAKHVEVPSIAPRSEDVSSIDGMLSAYYAVISGPPGKPREWGRDRTLYVPAIQFVILEPGSDGNIAAHVLTHQEFVDASDGEVVAKGFYEREAHRIVHRYGNVAHVFSTSEMRQTPAGPILGRSVDSLEMFWDGHRWWITNANIWPKERPGSPLPREFQPEQRP
jgi:hypothetical protein